MNWVETSEVISPNGLRKNRFGYELNGKKIFRRYL